MIYKTSSEKGVSLIEVLITLVVLGMGLMSLAKFQGTVMRDNGLAKARTVAAHLAQQQIESFRRYEVLTTTAGKLAFQDIAAGNDAPTVSSVAYTRSWTVTGYCSPTNYTLKATTASCTAGTVIPDLKMVTVTVSWVNQNGTTAGSTESVTLDTIISAVNPSDSGRIIEGI